MAFEAYEFTFRGQSCRQYDLLMYDLSGDREDVVFPSSGKAQMDKAFMRHQSALYVTEAGDPLSFPITFGLCPERIERRQFLDRFEMERIAAWLTGYDEWSWLTFDQPDLKHIRYRCVIEDLKPISSGWHTYGFTCKAVCDSPYAYMYPRDYTYHCDDKLDISFFNRSSMNRPYSPVVTIDTLGSADISILGKNGEGPAFSGLPALSKLQIKLDNGTEVMTNSEGLNLHPCFNHEYLRLKRGDNKLTVEGQCDITITCEFPVNVGG